MKGLELSEKYFMQYGQTLIKEKFSEYACRIAAGLVGEGSDCFGFDDEISRDHDWGPGFCLWLKKPDYDAIGKALQQEYDQLPKIFNGFPARVTTQLSKQRIGVFNIPAFYYQFIGSLHPPESIQDWCRIPEENLAAATNGKVFIDPLGDFCSFRNKLAAYYPEDLRLKKIAARCMTTGQSGQYNFLRCSKRGDFVAAHSSLAIFIKSSISLAFLLKKRYMPFYKWMYQALKTLPVLGEPLYPIYQSIVAQNIQLDYHQIFTSVELISKCLINELKLQDLSGSSSDFLCDHGPEVQQLIKDHQLKSMHVMSE